MSLKISSLGAVQQPISWATLLTTDRILLVLRRMFESLFMEFDWTAKSAPLAAFVTVYPASISVSFPYRVLLKALNSEYIGELSSSQVFSIGVRKLIARGLYQIDGELSSASLSLSNPCFAQ